jgi:hypothetical protein
MTLHGWKKYGLGAASMLVLLIAILIVSGWGTAAADQLFSVFITNTAANPVPVSGTLTVTNPPASPLAIHETNTDANGNIKVHEQGTADVNITNSSLPVGPPSPVTGGGGTQGVSGPSTVHIATETATFLSIHMDLTVGFVLLADGSNVVGLFIGPGDSGEANINAPLSRPITFDTIECAVTVGSGNCRVDWIGNSP